MKMVLDKPVKKLWNLQQLKIGQTLAGIPKAEYWENRKGNKFIKLGLDYGHATCTIYFLIFDYPLQKITQDAVRNCLYELEGDGSPPAGSAVVIKVDTGEVLAAATYPSYDVENYNEDYKKLVQNTAAPLWNRAFLSTYTPGSTMKPAISIAGLEEGLIGPDDGTFCNSTYTYKDITLGCTSAHGFTNVVSAIHHSCNIFFYQLGEKLGISTMNDYRKTLGFGQKTGIEVEEATGTLDSPAYRQTLGQEWYPGFTLQSAIGSIKDAKHSR